MDVPLQFTNTAKKTEKHSPTEGINMQNGDFSELGLCGVHIQGPECPSLQILKAILKWVFLFFIFLFYHQLTYSSSRIFCKEGSSLGEFTYENSFFFLITSRPTPTSHLFV